MLFHYSYRRFPIPSLLQILILYVKATVVVLVYWIVLGYLTKLFYNNEKCQYCYVSSNDKPICSLKTLYPLPAKTSTTHKVR